jgi:hypothetical protein
VNEEAENERTNPFKGQRNAKQRLAPFGIQEHLTSLKGVGHWPGFLTQEFQKNSQTKGQVFLRLDKSLLLGVFSSICRKMILSLYRWNTSANISDINTCRWLEEMLVPKTKKISGLPVRLISGPDCLQTV